MRADYIAVFFASLICICLELFFTRILNLKTWNHVVYTIIPFAILGYGTGANIYLISRNKISSVKKYDIVAYLLFFLGGTCILTTVSLIYLPIHLTYLTNIFSNIYGGIALSIAYTILMLPFVIIGFLVVYLFSVNPKISNRLYFWDLIGAGSGAIAFFVLINKLEVFRSIIFLSLVGALLSVVFFSPDKKWMGRILFFICLIAMFLPEPVDYNIDRDKGWQWVPGFFNKNQYETVVSRWNPLGRSDAYRFKDKMTRDELYDELLPTFEINVLPTPEFAYFCTDFLAGSPIYKLSKEGLNESNSTAKPFSQAMEFPYVLLNEPKVVIIGTGGGRDIFMAKTHHVKEVIGAEINPVIYSEMSQGGRFYEYSGGVYNLDGVNVSNVDGRHLVKKLKSDYFDLVILNGTDTFSGLSTGAYAYAESYLYTKNAMMDYLSIINKNGMINFNRWFYPGIPRETLRLFVIAMDALRSFGVERPWQHIIVGKHRGWGMMLIKKSPFTTEERIAVKEYFHGHETKLIFPASGPEASGEHNPFVYYAKTFSEGKEQGFIDSYPFDISVVYDNNPFFYKYYKLKYFHPKKIFAAGHPVTGTVVFISQLLVLIYAILFIVLFIITPLYIFKKDGIRKILNRSPLAFITFFSSLGVGFMFIEIPIMQRFVLLLGSPIYSISVSLAALLIFSGLGSYLLTTLQKIIKSKIRLLTGISSFLIIYLVCIISFGTEILDYFMYLSFVWRILIVCLILLPLGLCLGMFFPSGLQVISRDHAGTIAWAWGINCGFTVFGSILAIILAQFYGFNLILLLAAILYLIAILAFRRLVQVC